MTETNYEHQVESKTSFWAILSLISGIANYVGLPFFGALGAIIMGYVARDEIKKSQGQIEGERLANAGLVLGWIGIGLGVLTFCLVVMLIFGVIGGSIALIGPLNGLFNNVPTY